MWYCTNCNGTWRAVRSLGLVDGGIPTPRRTESELRVWVIADSQEEAIYEAERIRDLMTEAEF